MNRQLQPNLQSGNQQQLPLQQQQPPQPYYQIPNTGNQSLGQLAAAAAIANSSNNTDANLQNLPILPPNISGGLIPEFVDENWLPSFDTSNIPVSQMQNEDNRSPNDVFFDLINSTDFGYYN
ncbi:unnamed protein product [Ambrosiozyma monospora]|uniref:Unnamed protein product n=1 Tax=Ambrosiozyma monospora TaxID=43982 RepID=A0ACB5U758_AMBMO|nr:unnamed protein product [Ambrosiozyma monospora]